MHAIISIGKADIIVVSIQEIIFLLWCLYCLVSLCHGGDCHAWRWFYVLLLKEETNGAFLGFLLPFWCNK